MTKQKPLSKGAITALLALNAYDDMIIKCIRLHHNGYDGAASVMPRDGVARFTLQPQVFWKMRNDGLIAEIATETFKSFDTIDYAISDAGRAALNAA